MTIETSALGLLAGALGGEDLRGLVIELLGFALTEGPKVAITRYKSRRNQHLERLVATALSAAAKDAGYDLLPQDCIKMLDSHPEERATLLYTVLVGEEELLAQAVKSLLTGSIVSGHEEIAIRFMPRFRDFFVQDSAAASTFGRESTWELLRRLDSISRQTTSIVDALKTEAEISATFARTDLLKQLQSLDFGARFSHLEKTLEQSARETHNVIRDEAISTQAHITAIGDELNAKVDELLRASRDVTAVHEQLTEKDTEIERLKAELAELSKRIPFDAPRFDLAEKAMATGDHELADHLFAQEIEEHKAKSIEALIRAGQNKLIARMPGAAMNYLWEAWEKGERSERLLWAMHDAAFRLGDMDKQLLAAETLISNLNDPQDLARAYNSLGLAHERRNHIDDAMTAYDNAIQLCEELLASDETVQKSINFQRTYFAPIINRANLRVKQGKLDGAYEDYTLVISVWFYTLEQLQDSIPRDAIFFNDFAGVLSNRGNINLLRGDHDNSIIDFQLALDMRERLMNSLEVGQQKDVRLVYGLAQAHSNLSAAHWRVAPGLSIIHADASARIIRQYLDETSDHRWTCELLETFLGAASNKMYAEIILTQYDKAMINVDVAVEAYHQADVAPTQKSVELLVDFCATKVFYLVEKSSFEKLPFYCSHLATFLEPELQRWRRKAVVNPPWLEQYNHIQESFSSMSMQERERLWSSLADDAERIFSILKIPVDFH